MTPYYEDEAVTLYLDDCRDHLVPHGASVLRYDSIITDPPYDARTHAGARSAPTHSAKFGEIRTIEIDFDPLNMELHPFS